MDGYSRLPVYLHASSNNRAATVLRLFTKAVEEYGLPSRVRSDKGGENYEVGWFMLNHPSRGPGRGSIIAGNNSLLSYFSLGSVFYIFLKFIIVVFFCSFVHLCGDFTLIYNTHEFIFSVIHIQCFKKSTMFAFDTKLFGLSSEYYDYNITSNNFKIIIGCHAVFIISVFWTMYYCCCRKKYPQSEDRAVMEGCVW